MQRSYVMRNNDDSQPTSIGLWIILIFLGTAILSLQTPARDYIFPYAPYLQLVLQGGVFALFAPFLRIKMRAANLWLLIGLSALFGLALTSSFWSSYPELVIQRTFMILGSSLFIGLLVLSDTKPMATFSRLAKGLVLFGTVASLIGLIAYFFGNFETTDYGLVSSVDVGFFKISQLVYGPSPFFRISSLFGNPNTFASWLMVSLTMNVYLISKGSHRMLWEMFAIMQGIAIILTFSRAGIMATLISLILFWYFSASSGHMRRYRLLVMIFSSACLALLFAIFSDDALQVRLFSIDLNLRGLYWAPLWTSICSNPLLGVGFGVSAESILYTEGLELAAHNAFLAIMSEIGLLGFLLFIFVWLEPMWHAKKSLRFARPHLRLALAACLAIAIAMIPHQVFEGNILRYGFHTLFWIYLLTLMVHPTLMDSGSDV